MVCVDSPLKSEHSEAVQVTLEPVIFLHPKGSWAHESVNEIVLWMVIEGLDGECGTATIIITHGYTVSLWQTFRFTININNTWTGSCTFLKIATTQFIFISIALNCQISRLRNSRGICSNNDEIVNNCALVRYQETDLLHCRSSIVCIQYYRSHEVRISMSSKDKCWTTSLDSTPLPSQT